MLKGTMVHIVVLFLMDMVISQAQKLWSRRGEGCDCQSTEILFTDDMLTTIGQHQFLANNKNKQRFITGLKQHMKDSGITVHQAIADADTLIVHTALDMAQDTGNPIQVIGTDADLFVLLIQLSPVNVNIVMLKAGDQNHPDKLFQIGSIQHQLKDFRVNLCFLHAITGCDTTSALYRQGKKKAFQLLKKRPDLQRCVNVFNDPSSTMDSVAAAGEEFLLALYGAPKKVKSLDDYRHCCFMRAVRKCPIRTQLNMASLPPTSAAAREHSFRTYHQVQHWLGHEMEPTGWGWELVHAQLMPIMTSKCPAPDSLLNLMTCNCHSGCEKMCGCRKAGLLCSVLCGHCRGIGCANSEIHQELSGEDVDTNGNVKHQGNASENNDSINDNDDNDGEDADNADNGSDESDDNEKGLSEPYSGNKSRYNTRKRKRDACM